MPKIELCWQDLYVQGGHAVMGTCSTVGMGLTQQHWARLCSTTDTGVERATKYGVCSRSGASEGLPSQPWPPPISARPTGIKTPTPAGGAIPLAPTSTCPSPLSWRSLIGRLVSFRSCIAGIYVCIFFCDLLCLWIWSKTRTKKLGCFVLGYY